MYQFGKLDLMPLFAVPVAKVPLDNPVPADIVDFLINSPEIIDRPTYEQAMAGVYKPLTHDLKILDNPICKPLKDALMKEVRDYLYNILGCSKELDFRMVSSWVSKTRPGTNLGMHSHANSQFSGSLYLKVPKDSGRIIFHRRRHFDNVCSETLNIPMEFPTPFMAGGWPIDVAENELVIFPSNLEHSVEINNSDEDRISVPFNVVGYGVYGYESVTQIEIK
jgi:uncharacterized protein (TIGR02466 family)